MQTQLGFRRFPTPTMPIAALCLLILAGCESSPNYKLDTTVAQQSLETALKAWQSGEKQESLQQKSPKIVMADYEWEAGKKLVNFKINTEETKEGWNVRKTVELELEHEGQKSKDTVTYIIGTDPVVSIVRP